MPGGLARVSTEASSLVVSMQQGGGSKDTWVQAPQDFEEPPSDRTRLREALLPSQHVSSRVAEAFYWTGRYLERAHNLAVMIGVIESLELEELNHTERTLYRPVWNRILPPLENPGSVSRRNISSPAGRYRLTLDLEEPDSVVRAILRAAANAESILECVSLEAWSVLTTLRSRFQRARFRPPVARFAREPQGGDVLVVRDGERIAADARLDETLVAQDSDVVLVPEGYHPVASAAGYTTYYLNFLAGSAQSLANSDDPDHAWVKETWSSRDPRVPVVTLEMERHQLP
jgi:hypothetical protein